MESQNLDRIRFVTRHFNDLQGLRYLVPIGLITLSVGGTIHFASWPLLLLGPDRLGSVPPDVRCEAVLLGYVRSGRGAAGVHRRGAAQPFGLQSGGSDSADQGLRAGDADRASFSERPRCWSSASSRFSS